ncbi:MAG: sel1 repeat family protein [Myxococcales bacterium]|nr:sel1 repeat family protein [Myxococcales bacterium]
MDRVTRFLTIPGVVHHRALGSRRLVDYFKRLYRRALAGDGESQWEVGVNFFDEGRAFPMDAPTAVAWFRRAVASGYVPAMNNLAFALLKGLGVKRSRKAAVQLYEEAIALGDVAALCNLGRCYLRGVGVRRNVRTAVAYLRRAASRGYYFAAVELADAYELGEGVPVDQAKSTAWLRTAAALADGADDATATQRLALAYESGRGVKRSPRMAFRHMKQAAHIGDAAAWHHLGWYYHHGIGTPQSDRSAIAWYKRAARLGDAVSAFNIGVLYWEGEAKSLARFWFKRAGALGHERSVEFLRTRREELL